MTNPIEQTQDALRQLEPPGHQQQQQQAPAQNGRSMDMHSFQRLLPQRGTPTTGAGGAGEAAAGADLAETAVAAL
jgi:hypothetical protein